MFIFTFEIEYSNTKLKVVSSTYNEAMMKIKKINIPGMNLAELVLVEIDELEEFRFDINGPL